jgi:hypothetical protein
VHRGVPECPVDITAGAQDGQLDGMGHLLVDPFGAGRGRLLEPHRGTGADREERVLGGSEAWTR